MALQFKNVKIVQDYYIMDIIIYICINYYIIEKERKRDIKIQREEEMGCMYDSDVKWNLQ